MSEIGSTQSPNTPHQVSDLGRLAKTDFSQLKDKGRLQFGDHTYEVKWMNGQAQVSRDDRSSNWFARQCQSLAEFFTHRVGDLATSSRADRLAAALNRSKQAKTLGEVSQEAKQGIEVVNARRAYIDRGLEPMKRALQHHTIESHFDSCTQDMSDDKEYRKFLIENKTNPTYSSDNFLGIEPYPSDGSKFIAKFKGDNDLVFSNRYTTRELRGTKLKEILQNSTYENLQDCVGQTYLSDDDPIKIYATTGVKSNFMAEDISDLSPEQKQAFIDSMKGQRLVAGSGDSKTDLGIDIGVYLENYQTELNYTLAKHKELKEEFLEKATKLETRIQVDQLVRESNEHVFAGPNNEYDMGSRSELLNAIAVEARLNNVLTQE